MEGEYGKQEGLNHKNFSLLLEFSASDDLKGFKYAVEQEGHDVDEVGLWYGRRIGSRELGFEERTPLMIAAMFGSKDVLAYILETGRVDVNRTCGLDGATALHCAVAGGSATSHEVVKLLVDASADVGAVDANGKIPCDLIVTLANKIFNSRKRMLQAILKGTDGIVESGFISEEAVGQVEEQQQQDMTTPRVSKDGTEKKDYPVDLSLPDIKNGIYGTDEFRMYTFKVKPCSRAYSHDWTECPFVHPGENARRRDPRKYHYSCVPCPEFRKGSCSKGDGCEYAHGIFECWLHPAQYRTRLCKDEGACTRRVCFFAHKPEELRPLYASTGSAMPSPRAFSSTASSLEMGSITPLTLASPSVLMPPTSTPPLTPSGASSPGVGTMWPAQSSSAVPTLQLPRSRLKTALAARDLDLDIELLGLENHRRRHQLMMDEMSGLSSPSGWNNAVSNNSPFSVSLGDHAGELNRLGGVKPINLEDYFGSLDPSILSKLQGISLDAAGPHLQSPTGIQARHNGSQPKMAAVLAGDVISRQSSGSSSWRSTSVREMWNEADVFRRSSQRVEDDEEELKWAAIERLPTYERMRKGILKQITGSGRVVHDEVDVSKLGPQDKQLLMESILKVVEHDNERFLRRLRSRIDRVGIEIPKIEVRYEHLSIEGEAHVGTRALPTLLNSTLNTVEEILGKVGLSPSKKRVIKILQDVSGIVKPSRMTLLLGPPGAGKTTLLKALAGKLDNDLKITGRIKYCGHEFEEFIPQRTSAYISQHDLHYGEMTVRETFDFSGRCLGVGTRYDLLAELSRREIQAGIKPDPEIDAFMKAISVSGQETSLVTDYALKILGLDICADTVIGDEMRRGISGGQKKRVTTGEMLVGDAKAFFMDEISTGLDSSTTYQIVKFMRQIVHIMDIAMIIALLQPAPETFDIFDDIILLSDGQIVYQGPRENVLEFFEYMGFKCPERKGVADFLQEVTSKKDQGQYWFRRDEPCRFVSVSEFVEGFSSFHIGQQLSQDLRIPYEKTNTHPAALVKQNYGISNWELFRACFSREWLLMKRSSFVYIFKTSQITLMAVIAFTVFFRTEMETGQIEDGTKFWGALFYGLLNIMFNGYAELAMTVTRLPVFFKQRDFLFYPAWAFSLPIWVLRIPISIIESVIWVVLTYYTIGFAPAASRFFKQLLAFFGIHQMALSLFRFIAGASRTHVIANSFGFLVLMLVFVLGGYIISKDDIQSWLIWGYYISPMMYGQNAIAINEFLDDRWSTPTTNTSQPTVGKTLLDDRGLFLTESWYWISIGALFGFSILFNILFILALTYLNPIGDSKHMILEDDSESDSKRKGISNPEGTDMSVRNTSSTDSVTNPQTKRGMVLPFQPLSLAFNHVNYYVDMPAEMKSQGVEESRLHLLKDVSGAFRPGVLTALVGVSGAGKTTLMDVLAGRKTSGYIEGSISISGYPKNQDTFARISGYCEQNDIHSPYVTVYESLLYSAWLRLPSDVNKETRKMFVEEVMELVELNPLRNALVGLPGVDGLSTEQRKRLTIAVELVANPSIIFMDEPTSGLDARAAAIVMRTVRNTVDTGRTVLCTIHQPSVDIFEAFDELFLMKRGGRVIYAGPLGHHSHKLIEYFEAIPGVPKIKEGNNPATWMLEVSTSAVEAQLNIDFADVYANSDLYRRNQELIEELSTPLPGSQDLYFPTKYSQSFITQCLACFWKQHWSYWRNSQFNAVRFFMTTLIGISFGVIFWNKGEKLEKQQDLTNLFGATYAAVLFLGATNCSAVQPVLSIERTVFYRERAAGMYSEMPYAIAQLAIEMIYVAIQAIIYALILYSMIGYNWDAGKFFYFYYFIFMCFTYFSLYGMMVIALTPGQQIAAILMAFFMNFWNLFSGFLIPRPLIPIWWRWYYWASPIAWTIYGVFASQFGDVKTMLEIPGEESRPVNVYLKDSLGFDHDFLVPVVFAHVGWVILFMLVFAYCIKFLNFQKR